jgi:hypothetical protein
MEKTQQNPILLSILLLLTLLTHIVSRTILLLGISDVGSETRATSCSGY